MSITLLHRVLERVKIPREVDSSETAHMNRDTRPLPPSRRPYGPWHFVGFWVVTGAFNVGGWTTGSSLIVLGLNVWQSMLTVIIGNCIVGIICVFAGMPGAQWHIGFPIFQRASWGMRGHYFPLSNRILLSFVWFSTHCWWGSQCLKTFFIALWPSYRNLDTPIANGTMNTGDFVTFILFWLICLPQCFVNPERYKIPFIIFSCSVIPTVFILLIYYLVTAGGGGTLLVDAGAVTGIEQATGSHLGWMLVLGITSNIGSMATSLLSQSDYSRFARKPTDQLISQLVMAPLGAIIVALIGIICASCAAQLYPEHATLSALTFLKY
jgi:NCS1 family nucleobase:cation symporter-1